MFFMVVGAATMCQVMEIQGTVGGSNKLAS